MTLPDIKFQANFTERPFAGKRRASDGSVMLDINIDSQALPDGAATSENQTNGDQLTQITQHVVADPNNSSDDNLTIWDDWTFVGEATSTLGVVGLQWSLKTDQNATVYIEESPDELNWDISRSFDYIASHGGRGETVQASQAFWRIRVYINTEINTTFFRLQGVLCPIATPLPSALSRDGRLKSESTITGRENTDRHVFVAPLNSLTTNSTVRLVGTSFDGLVKDTNFWLETGTTGSVTQAGGEIVLATTTTANFVAKYFSKRSARFVVSRPLKFFGFYALATDPQANNVRRWGAYDTLNGFFFEQNGTAFRLMTRKGVVGTVVDTPISSGSFNGNYGTTWQPLADEKYYRYEIEYGAFGVSWYVDGKLLHELGIGHWTNTLTLPITMENNNSGGNATNNLLDCIGTSILGQGELLTSPTSYYHASGQTAGVNLKVGAGNLHSIIFGSAANNAVVTLVDSTTAGTPILWQYQATGALDVPIDVQFNGMPFYTGLRLIVATGNASCTVVYE